MKRHFSIFLAALLATACGSSGQTRPTEATFSVTVNPMDKKGGVWDKHDANGHPDIGLCITTEMGKRCYPGDKLRKSQCPDTYKCTFSNIPIPPGKFTVRVVDVDFSNNETVGEGTCDWNKTCTIGQSEVKIR
jgi:hypothetical protein